MTGWSNICFEDLARRFLEVSCSDHHPEQSRLENSVELKTKACGDQDDHGNFQIRIISQRTVLNISKNSWKNIPSRSRTLQIRQHRVLDSAISRRLTAKLQPINRTSGVDSGTACIKSFRRSHVTSCTSLMLGRCHNMNMSCNTPFQRIEKHADVPVICRG